MKAGLTPEFWSKWNDMCASLKCDPVHLAMVVYSESGWNSTAYNQDGPAGGLIQFMQVALNAVGFPGTPRDITLVLPKDQIPFIYNYYKNHSQWLTDPGSIYLVNFLPAYIKSAKDNQAKGIDLMLGMKGGAGFPGIVYKLNAGLDANRDGFITFSDLGLHLQSVCRGSAWEEIKAAASMAVPGSTSAYRRPFDWRLPWAVRGVQRALQVILTVHPNVPISVDGQLGPVTTGYVKEFQSSVGIVTDGLPGPATRKALAKALKARRPG